MIQAIELIQFVKQASIALVGAAALWGLIYYYKARHARGEKKDVFTQISKKMLEPLTVALAAFTVTWMAIDFSNYTVNAHEGIILDPTKQQLLAGAQITEPFVLALFAIFIIGILYRAINQQQFNNHIHYFYAPILALATIIISLPVWTGQLDADKMFFIWHNAHSILTLGTVLILDFVMLVAKYADKYKKHLYPTLPLISKVIWLGLALDFLSVAFVFERAIEINAQWMFMQTVVAVIIINGIFLSGPMTQKLISTVQKNGVQPLPKKWNQIATICGCISIASWTTITFTDFLKGIDAVSYGALIAFYLGFILLTYLVYEILEHYKVGHNW